MYERKKSDGLGLKCICKYEFFESNEMLRQLNDFVALELNSLKTTNRDLRMFVRDIRKIIWISGFFNLLFLIIIFTILTI